MELDEKDIKILKALQSNCRRFSKAIAHEVAMPPTTTHDRIRKLEKNGIIKDYKAILDAKKVDRGATVFIFLAFEHEMTSALEKKIAERKKKKEGEEEEEEISTARVIAEQLEVFPEVQEIHIITGQFDILVKAKGKDVDSVGKLVLNKIREMDGIRDSLTSVVFDTVLETTDIRI